MEVIAFITLAIAGFIVNKRRAVHASLHSNYNVSGGDDPGIAADLYEQQGTQKARQIEFSAASQAYNKSLYPERSGVIPRNYTDRSVHDDMVKRSRGNDMVSQLSGSATDFSHTNMTPFFGGHVRQSVNPTANNDIIERFTGITPQGGVPQAAKVEASPLFSPVPVGNVYGAPSVDLNAAIERLPIQRFKDNDLPFRQVNVGPAIGAGFTAEPGDSYLTGREYQIPKDTDQLRTTDHPKVSFPGRTIAGAQPIQSRAELGAVDPPRYPQRYKETFTSDDWMKTTGQNLGETVRPEEITKDVIRSEMHVPYQGSAAPTSLSTSSYADPGQHSESHRSEAQRLPFGPAAAVAVASTKGDFGRANILVYANERDTTNVPVFAGTSTSIVKSIITPLLDMVRPARRQVLGTTSARAYGNVGMMIPEKLTVRDPDGVLRTTIRETTQQETTKPGALGSLRGPTLSTVYDPLDIARTTLKEQMIHDTPGAFAPAPSDRRTGARDPDDHTRITTRQTLDCTNTSINPSAPTRGQLLRDPSLAMRNTVKETTVTVPNAETDGTSVGGLQGDRGGYTSADMVEPAVTTRQFLSLKEDDHVGPAGTTLSSAADAYRIANARPRDISRQVLCDNSYYGGGKQGDAQTSQDDYLNATVRPEKEILSLKATREFGPSGSKDSIGKEDVDLGDVRKVALSIGIDDRLPSKGRIMPSTVDMACKGLPEVGRENTCGILQHSEEGTRGSRGTFADDLALPQARFAEDVLAMSEVRLKNPIANPGFYSS